MCIHCAVTHNPSDYVYLMICWFSSLQVTEGNERNTPVQEVQLYLEMIQCQGISPYLFKHDLVL